MDVSEMSLINQMLQDLEGRRSEGQVAGAMHGQVRAAPEPKRIHVAWWLVFGLTLILTGLISWLWGYRTSPAVVSTAPVPRLALKLEPSIELPPVLNAPSTEEASGNAAVVAATAMPIANGGAGNAASNAVVGQQTSSNAATIPVMPLANQAPAALANPPVAVPILAVVPARGLVAPAPVAVSPPASPTAQADSSSLANAASKTGTAVPATGNVADLGVQKTGKETEFDIPANVAKQIKELTPVQRAEEEYRRATVLIDQGKSREAVAALEKALQLDPNHSVARQTMAGLLLDAKRPDEAIRKLQDGLNADRNHPALAMMLARLQVDKGELRPAVETLQRTLSHAAERADYQAFLAALLQREGRHKEAAEHFKLALRKSPQNGLWWMGIGISLQADNRLGDARDAFVRARESNNLSPELLAFVNEKLNQLR